jgi:hypothetical protein
MIKRTIAGTALTLLVLGVWSEPSPAASLRDIGVACIRGDNEIVSRRVCTAAAAIELTRGPGICGDRIVHATSGAAYFTAIARIRATPQNVCARTHAFVPASYLLSRLP